MSMEGYGGHTPNYEDWVVHECAELEVAFSALSRQALIANEGSTEQAAAFRSLDLVDLELLTLLDDFEPTTREQLYSDSVGLADN
jgi:hypothetical protein